MTTDYTNRIVLILMIILFFAHSGGGGPAPFKAEGLVVLCLEDKTYEGHAALTPEQDDIMRAQDDTSFRKFILDNGGDFQIIDLSQNVADDAPWVKAAVEAAKGLDQSKFPWVLCASPRGGFSMAIPPDAKPEEFIKKAKPLVVAKKSVYAAPAPGAVAAGWYMNPANPLSPISTLGPAW
jgi:hypothetical protein